MLSRLTCDRYRGLCENLVNIKFTAVPWIELLFWSSHNAAEGVLRDIPIEECRD